MNHRPPVFIALALALCLFLTPSGAGQQSVLPSEEFFWGNPYPGLGNGNSGSATHRSSMPPTVTLYADPFLMGDASELPPTQKSGELYLARLPGNRRTGMFQRINFNTLWVPKSGSNGLGMTELDLSAMFALPMLTKESPLLITPRYSTTFFDHKHLGSETFHTTGISVRWLRPIIKQKLTADLGVGVSYSGDFHAKGSDTIRVPIHAVGIWNFNPRTKILLGVAYLDRKDSFNWFPMAGLIWTPNEDVSIELIVPRMRIAQRIRWFDSTMGDEQSDWLYTAFEFGGGSWGYDASRKYEELGTGRLEYRDLRLLLGYERRTRFGLTLGLEVGYMFDRNWEFGGFKDRPSDSVFLRLRSSF